MINLHNLDCREALRTLEECSVDSIVTDPPYGLSFMGKTWDYDVPSVEIWTECLRVLKPGGHLLAFSGTRTYHRMVCAIEDAGFEIRDQIGWVYGSGFPKSLDVSKAIDKAAGAERQWEGWGTALKPAWEPIVVARKPLIGTVAANVLAHGTGALNIDGCRVPTDEKLGGGAEKCTTADQKGNEGWTRPWMDDAAARDAHAARVRANVAKAEGLGRWPANLIHDGSDEVLAAFPQAPGQMAKASTSDTQRAGQNVYGVMQRGPNGQEPRPDAGSAARFFYCAKASKRDRGEGNTHPTVKPTDLMRYLVRLVTPPGGLVLDPFMGSGSTGKAAALEGFRFIGCERSASYFDIACKRLGYEVELW